jgi:hypothetical protein
MHGHWAASLVLSVGRFMNGHCPYGKVLYHGQNHYFACWEGLHPASEESHVIRSLLGSSSYL